MTPIAPVLRTRVALAVGACIVAVLTACGQVGPSQAELRQSAADHFSALEPNPRPERMAVWRSQLSAITFPDDMRDDVKELVAAAAAAAAVAPCRHYNDPVSCAPITAHATAVQQRFHSAYAVVRHDLRLPAA